MLLTMADWQTVSERIRTEERERLGDDLPTVDEILAYERGEVTEEQAERVRSMFLAYPEIARAVITPYDDDALDRMAPVLTDEEVEESWLEFRSRYLDGGAV